jgi:hypothetical protein
MIKVLWGTGLDVNGQVVPLNRLSELVDEELDLQDLVLLASGANLRRFIKETPPCQSGSDISECGSQETEEEGD